MLTWEQLNRLHPADAEARRRLASFYERAGQKEALAIWREAISLGPDNAEGRLGLARTALRFGDLAAAREALENADRPVRLSAEFHRLRAGLALLERDIPAQEESLIELSRLEPEDDRVRLNLAIIRLRDPRGPKAEEARTVLLALARRDKVRMRAVAELLGDLARRWPVPTSEREVALRALADALTPPRGPLLLMPSQVDHLERLVRYAMEQPAPEPEDVISLATWMSLNGQAEAALVWIDTLPRPLADNPLLRTVQAEFAVRVRDWSRLRQLLLAGAWGPVPGEAVEQAFRAQSGPARDHPVGGRAGWSTALDAAKASPAGLRMLLRLAEAWEWPVEHRLALLAIARTMPRETWAWRELISQALIEGDSEQLWEIYGEWRLALPSEPGVQVESAIMGSLLGRRRIFTTAETAEMMDRQPRQPGAAVAHALSLWRAGRAVEAVAVLDAQTLPVFSEPRYALARGIVLAEVGRAGESEEMLNRLADQPLLPEERELVAAARHRNLAAGL